MRKPLIALTGRHCGSWRGTMKSLRSSFSDQVFLYQGISCRVLHAGRLSDCIDVNWSLSGMPAITLLLYLVFIDWITRTTTSNKRNAIQCNQWALWSQLEDLDFADDLALLSHKYIQMHAGEDNLICCPKHRSEGIGLKINQRKTQPMKINTNTRSWNLYLGSIIDIQGDTEQDVTARIGKARTAFISLKNTMVLQRNQHFNKATHLQLQC